MLFDAGTLLLRLLALGRTPTEVEEYFSARLGHIWPHTACPSQAMLEELASDRYYAPAEGVFPFPTPLFVHQEEDRQDDADEG